MKKKKISDKSVKALNSLRNVLNLCLIDMAANDVMIFQISFCEQDALVLIDAIDEVLKNESNND